MNMKPIRIFILSIFSIIACSCGIVQMIVGPTQSDWDNFQGLYEKVNNRPDMMKLIAKGRDKLHITGDRTYVYCVLEMKDNLHSENASSKSNESQKYSKDEVIRLSHMIQEEMKSTNFPYALHIETLGEYQWIVKISKAGKSITWNFRK